jgi:cytochrome c
MTLQSKKKLGLVAGLLLATACSQPGVYRSQPLAAKPVSTESLSADSTKWPATFGIGRLAADELIRQWDTDVRPDGQGLPAGSGNAATGKILYAAKCAACHGATGTEGPYNKLVSHGQDKQEKTIGNYWPYATTLYDYIGRAMPYNQPGSLTADEIYSLTAFLLSANRITDSTTVLNAQTLPAIKMPAQPQFVDDDRKGGPEVR